MVNGPQKISEQGVLEIRRRIQREARTKRLIVNALIWGGVLYVLYRITRRAQ